MKYWRHLRFKMLIDDIMNAISYEVVTDGETLSVTISIPEATVKDIIERNILELQRLNNE